MLLGTLDFPAVTLAPARGAGYRRWRWAVSGTVAGALLIATTSNGRAAAAGILHLRCTNTASGTSWPIVVDLDHARVDSQPATITDKWITWPDPKQGFFDFERDTGKLQFRNASSTGGYFLYYTCRQE